MARKPRIEFSGAFYHVLTRGNQRQKIFLDKKDFLKYLKFLGDYKIRYSFRLYGYVLMPNHVHLLIETGETPLSKILQGINQRYTMYFNWKYETVGHLFQGRYKAVLCDKEAYLVKLVNYLHNNPVRAGLAKKPDEYPWSSHRFFLRPRLKGVADAEAALRWFSPDLEQAARVYRDFMGEEGIRGNGLEKKGGPRIIGGEEFLEKILEKEEESFFSKRGKINFDLEIIGRAVGKAFGINPEELKGKARSLELIRARGVFCRAAKGYGYRGAEIGEYLGRDPGAVSKYMRRGEALLEERGKVAEIIGG